MVIKNKIGQKGPAYRPAPPNRGEQAGQALLIVVLVMVVGLTIGLSIVSKSITNVRTTTEEANSAQALAAAEAGVAQAIQTNQGVPIGSDITYGNNASFTSSISQSAGQTTVILNGGNIVPRDEGADLWLVDHDSSGVPVFGSPWTGTLINIYWGDSTGECEQAALEILVIKGSSLDPTSSRYAIDPCTSRRIENNFTSPSILGSPYPKAGKIFSYTFQISATSGLIARIIPIYKNAMIAVESAMGQAFPSQGAVITSTGKAKDTTIQRKLNVFQGFSYLPVEYVTYGVVEHK